MGRQGGRQTTTITPSPAFCLVPYIYPWPIVTGNVFNPRTSVELRQVNCVGGLGQCEVGETLDDRLEGDAPSMRAKGAPRQ